QGEQVVAAGHVAVDRGRHHVQFAGDRPQRESRRAVDREVTAADLDDLRLDSVAGVLTLAHSPSVAQIESTALAFWPVRWQPGAQESSALEKFETPTEENPMTIRYEAPKGAAQAFNTLFRWLAEAGVSIAGTTALQV